MSIHRITPDDPPQFPCWLWSSNTKNWWRRDTFPDAAPAGEYTHWHPEQPPPTDGPSDDPSTEQLRSELEYRRKNAQPATDTPLTDAAEPLYHQEGSNPAPFGYVPADFARRLERDNARLREALASALATMSMVHDAAIGGRNDEVILGSGVECARIQKALQPITPEAQP